MLCNKVTILLHIWVRSGSTGGWKEAIFCWNLIHFVCLTIFDKCLENYSTHALQLFDSRMHYCVYGLHYSLFSPPQTMMHIPPLLYPKLLFILDSEIPIHLAKSNTSPCFDWNAIHPYLVKLHLGLTPAIKSVDTCHESFIMMRREWRNTQVLSQRGSHLTRSIYTLSLWIRPRECHTAAQSTLLLVHPHTTRPSVCTNISPIRELSATHRATCEVELGKKIK